MTRTLSTLLLLLLINGCARGPSFFPAEKQTPIDRSIIETPAGFNIAVFASGFTAPSAICFDPDGVMFIAESGVENDSPRIIALKTDGSTFIIYPTGSRLSVPLFKRGFRLHGPIGGMVVHNGRLYVTHRDGAGKGVITAFGYDGTHETIIADLPCQGDYSVTDIAVRPSDGRIIFGVGSATNSGVVGLDNWAIGWPRKCPSVCDQLAVDMKLNGYRMDSKNPLAGLFGGGDETAVTGAFQPFGQGYLTRIPRASNGKPNAAIYSIDPNGGDLQIEAHGIRYPAGLGFFGKRPFATNQGMEMRGTRPIKDDPDAFLRVLNDAWYGWPDYSADLWRISDTRFQPPRLMIQKTGYTEISPLIDASSSNLSVVERDVALQGTFPSQSGASKFAFPADNGSFKQFFGSAIVACFGDRSPFSTSNEKLLAPVGFKVMRVSLDEHAVNDFIVNTQRLPASKLGRSAVALERPIDVKFAPDGSMYILDFGVMRMKDGKMDVKDGTGRIFKVVPQEAPTTSPAN
jgi:glucose/arabinose dehydrogenase